jgi:hypothetical protein
MKANQIREGETYRFVATDAPGRKHLEGEEFTVVRIETVWRRIQRSSRRVRRFFNEAGDAARAEELEPLDDPQETPQQAAAPIDDLPF